MIRTVNVASYGTYKNTRTRERSRYSYEEENILLHRRSKCGLEAGERTAITINELPERARRSYLIDVARKEGRSRMTVRVNLACSVMARYDHAGKEERRPTTVADIFSGR